MKRTFLGAVLLFLMLLPAFLSAQTVFFEPQNINVNPNTQFSLPLKINNVNNLFGVNFDLNFDPNLLEYVSTQEGDFLKQGCSTILMTNANTSGKLIFGLTRLGSSCGGVSGSGLIATIKFSSKNQNGAAVLTFSNNSLCILSGSSCNYITGVWNPATVTIGNPDTTPPVISSVSASAISSSGATISWTTNEASDSQVEYGLTNSYGSQTTLNASMVISHSQTLSGLSANTAYHYRVKSKDAAGNLAVSSDYAFTTLPGIPANCPLNTEVSETQATLAGEITDDGGDPNLQVWFQYGKTTSYSFQTAHSSKYGLGLFCATVSNLEPCATYHYRAVAQNSAATSYGENKTFTTKCAPVSVDIKANGSNGPVNLNYQESVNLSWTSQNAVSCGGDVDWSGSKTTSGSQTIQLNSVKTYNFTIVCKNADQTQTSTDSVQVIVKAKPPTVITKPAVVTW